MADGQRTTESGTDVAVWRCLRVRLTPVTRDHDYGALGFLLRILGGLGVLAVHFLFPLAIVAPWRQHAKSERRSQKAEGFLYVQSAPRCG